MALRSSSVVKNGVEPNSVRFARIGTFTAAQWQGPLDYVTTQGVPVSLPFTPTLGHVINHGTHHRGQVTAALTALGQPAPVIDLVYMLVEEQKQP